MPEKPLSPDVPAGREADLLFLPGAGVDYLAYLDAGNPPCPLVPCIGRRACPTVRPGFAFRFSGFLHSHVKPLHYPVCSIGHEPESRYAAYGWKIKEGRQKVALGDRENAERSNDFWTGVK